MLLTNSAAAPVANYIPARFRRASLEDLTVPMRLQVHEAAKAGKGIVFEGATGRGKTHAMCAVANDLGVDGFVAWLDFLETIRAWWRLRTDDAHRFDPSRWAERSRHLFIDDVGTEESRSNTELGAEAFAQVVNARYKAGLVTHVTTNLGIEELGKRYGDRTVSRLAETCVWVQMTGEDRRLA